MLDHGRLDLLPGEEIRLEREHAVQGLRLHRLLPHEVRRLLRHALVQAAHHRPRPVVIRIDENRNDPLLSQATQRVLRPNVVAELLVEPVDERIHAVFIDEAEVVAEQAQRNAGVAGAAPRLCNGTLDVLLGDASGKQPLRRVVEVDLGPKGGSRGASPQQVVRRGQQQVRLQRLRDRLVPPGHQAAHALPGPRVARAEEQNRHVGTELTEDPAQADAVETGHRRARDENVRLHGGGGAQSHHAVGCVEDLHLRLELAGDRSAGLGVGVYHQGGWTLGGGGGLRLQRLLPSRPALDRSAVGFHTLSSGPLLCRGKLLQLVEGLIVEEIFAVLVGVNCREGGLAGR